MGKPIPATQKISGKGTGKHSKTASYMNGVNFNGTQGSNSAAQRIQSGNNRKGVANMPPVTSGHYLKTDGS